MMDHVPEPGSAPTIAARGQAAMIIVLAMTGSVVMLAVVGTMVIVPKAGDAPLAMTVPIVSAALFATIGSVLFRRLNLQLPRLQQAFARGGEAGLADHLFRVTLVSAAFAEAVAMIGFVLGFLTGDTYYFYALCLVSLIGVLCNLPRTESWRGLLSEITMNAQSGLSSGRASMGG